MSPIALGGVLFTAMVLLALALNHVLARVGIVELGLSQGHPPEPGPVADRAVGPEPFAADHAVVALPDNAVSLFVSATCVSCARLVDDLAAPELDLPFELDLFFSGHRSPLARRGTVHEDQSDLIAILGIPVTPYAVAIEEGQVEAHGAVADLEALSELLAWDLLAARSESLL